MVKKLLHNFKIFIVLLLSGMAYSQNSTPITVSGFNFDGVAEAVPALLTTTGPLDGSNNVLYSQAYGTSQGIGGGLANSRIYTSGSATYSLQPYNQNNMLRLTAGQTGTLNFVSPSSYSQISLLGFNAEQTGPFNYTINFDDGTSIVGSSAFPDWFSWDPFVAMGLGNISRNDNGGTQGGLDPKIFKIDINLTGADAYKKIIDITFTTAFVGAQGMHIMAVSGVSNIKNDAGQCGAVVNYSLPNANPLFPRVLLLGVAYVPSYLTDAQTKLAATGMFSSVDTFNTLNATPTLALLNQYDCVLVWTQHDPLDKVALGNVLVQYIDGGGGVVDAFATSLDTRVVDGNFNTDTYRVINPSANYSTGGNVNLGTISLPGHPIMQGVLTFGLTSGGYFSTGTTLATDAYSIAAYNDNNYIVCAKENVGPLNAKRVTLNFFPFSSDQVPAGWDASTDGATLMANSLKWVADPYTQTAGLASGSVFPLGTTTNTFTYTDSNNAVQTYSFDITVNDTEDPVITCIPDAVAACDGTFAFATPTFTDNCTGAAVAQTAGLPSGSVFPVGPTINTFVVTDASGNTATCSFTVTRNPDLSATASQVDILCYGDTTGSASVVAAGGTGAGTYTYLWSNGETTDSIANITAGNYGVTITDGNGCELTVNFTITEPTSPLSQTPSQVDVLCFGDATGSATVVVNGGTAPYTYLWSDGQTTAEATGLIAGNYSVTITDDNGCELTENFTITQPNAPLSQTPSQLDVLCFGDVTGSATVVVNGGTAPYTYLWSDGQTIAEATGLGAGNYSVTITDDNGCVITENFTITEPNAPLSQTSSQVDVLCFGDATGSAEVIAAGGTAPYTYLWSDGQVTAEATGLIAGNYSVTITDGNGCELTENFTITEPTSPLSQTPSQVDVLCFGDATGSAEVIAAGGTAPYTYLWSDGQITAEATGLIAGNYSVTITDDNGCELTENFTITEPNTPLSLTPNTTHTNVLCHGGATGSATVAVAGGTAPYTYLWNNGQTTPAITGLIAGDYGVTVTDTNGCTLTENYTITEPEVLAAAITHENVSCFGGNNGTATAIVTGGTVNYTYSWNTAPVQTTAEATGLTAGIYTVTVTDANGCTTTAMVTITEPDAPISLTTSQTNVSCFAGNDGALTVTATGGTGPYTYTWTPAVSTTNTAAGLTVGNYSIVVTDANGCTDLRYLSISSPTELTGNVNVTNISCNGYDNGSAVVTVSGGVAPYSYLWSDGTTSAANQNLAPGTYTVVVTDAHDCTFTSGVTLTEPAAIIITSQPDDVTVDAGQTAVFTVAAQNAALYQWQVSTNDGETWFNVANGGTNPYYTGATASTLTVTGIPAGFDGYQYRAVVSQQGTCYVFSDEALLTVIPPVAGIEDVKKLSMSLYPNPASVEVFVTIPDFESFQNLKVAMYDLNGRLVKNESAIKSDDYRIDVTGLESGVYIITITSDRGRTDKKVIVNKRF